MLAVLMLDPTFIVARHWHIVVSWNNETQLEALTMALNIPPSGAIRVSRGNFDPTRFVEVQRMTRDTGAYLIPSIKRLDGLFGYFARTSPSGSMVHVTLWQSEAEAHQMGKLKEMTENACRDAQAVGVEFTMIINYPVAWSI
jgi:hypothetical protein